MNPAWLIPLFASSFASLLLAAIILLKRRRGSVEGSLIAVLGTIAWVQAGHALGLLDNEKAEMWKQLAMIGEIIFPIALYKVGASFISDKYTPTLSETTWRFRALASIGVLCASFLVVPILLPGSEALVLLPPTLGKIIGIFILVSLVMALAQLEQVLRASRDPLRYQIKFVIIGLGGLAGLSILQASQLEVFAGWNTEYSFAGGTVTFVSIGLIAFGLGRWHLQDMSQVVYISPQALYTSMTLLIVGGYLIVVGGLGEFIRRTGWAMGESVGLLFMFIASMALIVILSSRQAKAELRLLLTRHFLRSKYDYRLKWIEVTDVFRPCDSVESILDNCLELLIRTFGVEHVSIWLLYDADGRFHQVRSANIETPPPPLEANHPIRETLLAEDSAIEFIKPETLDTSNWSAFLAATNAKLCAPLKTPDTLHGFVTLSPEFGNRQFSQDDFDLLTSITHYLAVQLAQAKLAEERTATAKWEAVSRFSAFYLHDLKTLIAGLSMVAQNAEVYGHDPAFQESAMRTVTNTVKKLTGLINKLSAQTKSVTPHDPEAFHTVSINDIVAEATRSLATSTREPACSLASSLSPVSIVPDQFKQMLMNLVMNAHQSAGHSGEIEIKTEQANDTVTITIADSGPGIPETQLRTLFQPFKTTKTDGIGIGLYQCKAIVEQSKGIIRIESQEGHGTQVHITLPAAQKEAALV